MKKIIHFIKTDRAMRASIVMVGGNFLANIGAYLYHLFMGRLLLPSDYGALQSLISLLNILNVPLVVLNTVVTKYVATYVGKGESDKISYFHNELQKYCFITLLIGGVLFLLFKNIILTFLHIDSWLNYLLLDFSLFFGLVSILNRATLQGLSLFFYPYDCSIYRVLR